MTDAIEQPAAEPDPTPEADAPRLVDVSEGNPDGDGPGITDDLATSLVSKIRSGQEAPVVENEGRSARDSKGRFASLKAEDETPEDADDSAPEGEAETEGPDEAALAAARADILRVGLMDPEDVAEASPETIQRWAERAKAIKAQRDREFAKLKQDKDPVEDEPEATAVETKEAAGQAKPSLDIDELLKPLAEELGDDAAAPFRKAVEFLAAEVADAKKAADEARRDAAQIQQSTQAQQAEAVESAVEKAREALGERFSETQDDTKFESEIAPTVQALASADGGNRYKTVDDIPALVEAACRALGYEDKKVIAASASREKTGPKRAGLPVTTAAMRKAEATMTPEQWQTELTGAIRANDQQRISQLQRIAPRTPL